MPNPFKRVLCAIDFSISTKRVIETAREIVGRGDSVLILLHVVPLPIEAVGQPIMVEPLAGAEQDARERLARIAQESPAIKCEIAVVTGDPAQSILEVASEQHADLIVMATHGRTGLSHFFIGSVAERVVRESPVPVLTVRAPTSKGLHLSTSTVI